MTYTPELPSEQLARLRPAVLAVVARTPSASPTADRTRLSIVYRYAAYRLNSTGRFDPVADFDDAHLTHYWSTACSDLAPRSRDKALSELRTVGHGAPFAAGLLMRRPVSAAPYDEATWSRYRNAANELPEPWRSETRVLLDLTGEMGLRGAEVARAHTEDIGTDGTAAHLRVGGPDPETSRLLPIPQRLTRAVRHWTHDRFLLRPEYRNRKNAVGSLLTCAARRDPAFADFKATSARHRWLAQLMRQPVPLTKLLYLADLRADSHTLQDVAEHLEPYSPANDPRP